MFCYSSLINVSTKEKPKEKPLEELKEKEKEDKPRKSTVKEKPQKEDIPVVIVKEDNKILKNSIDKLPKTDKLKEELGN